MKKLILILVLMFCLIFSGTALGFEKVDVSGAGFDTDVIFRAKIVEFLEQLNFTSLEITDALGNGRQIHWQFTATAIESGEQLQGIQLRSSWGGTADSANAGITGIEIKARSASDSITHTLGQARAIVGNVDVKKATFSKGYCFEAAIDVSSGGTITEAIGFRSFLNNSGTVTHGYAFYVDAESGNPWEYGLYVEDGMATTGVFLATTIPIVFRDEDLKIYSSEDGQLDIASDSQIEVLVGTTVGVDYFRVKGASKFHNRPLDENTFAVEIKADAKYSTGTFTGALQNTVRSYPTSLTTATTVSGADFTTYLHDTATMTSGYLFGLAAKVENQGIFNGSAIIMTPIYSLVGEIGTFTAVNHICGLWLDSHLDSTITSGSFEFLYMTNNGDTQMDTAVYLTRSRVTNFVTFDGSGAMIGAHVADEASSGRIKIDVDGATRYLYYYD